MEIIGRRTESLSSPLILLQKESRYYDLINTFTIFYKKKIKRSNKEPCIEPLDHHQDAARYMRV